MFTSSALIALAGTVSATVLWDGRCNEYTSSAFLDDWSFSNEVGPYQYYIHGTGNVTDYVNLGTEYKNPADTSSTRGIQITNSATSQWNSDGMLRTELIPQTTAAINAGKVFYHFSMQHTGTNPPSALEEHQINFFESHFTEMKYGLISGESGTSDAHLRWEASSVSYWNTTFEAGVWHNVAYAIDFDAGSVSFYHSTGADDLTLTAGPVSVTASSNGADWHLGVLRLGTTDTATEDWHFSGVYIESGSLTTSVVGPGGSTGSSSAASSATTAAATSATSVAAASSAAPATTSKASSTSVSSAEPTSTSVSSAEQTSTSVVEPVSSSSSVKPTSTVATTKATSKAATSAAASTLSTVAKASTISAVLASSSSAAAESCRVVYVYE